MERLFVAGEEGVGSGIEGVRLLAKGADSGGVVFCPALGEVGVEETSGDTGGGDWGEGGSSSYDGAVLADWGGMGVIGSEGSAVMQAGEPDGLFSQLEEAGIWGYI